MRQVLLSPGRFVWPSCSHTARLSRRLISTEASGSSEASSSVASTSRSRYAPIPHRGFISVTGTEPNLSTFLNGILATQVNPIVANEAVGFYTTFLNRHGRILYDVFFHPHPLEPTSGYIIEYDPRPLPTELQKATSASSSSLSPHPDDKSLPTLPALLKRFVLRSKVRVKDVSAEWDAWALWGDSKEDQAAEKRRLKSWTGWRWGSVSSAVEPTWLGRRAPDIRLLDGDGHSEGGGDLPFAKGPATGLWDWRAPGMGRRLILPKGEAPQVDDGEYSAGTEIDYTTHRIMTGVPEGTIDMVDAIPFDRNVDIMGGVDFRKGCYVGQENVVRTYHTGMVRKRTIPVQLQLVSSNGSSSPSPNPLSDVTLRLTETGLAARSTSTASAPAPRTTARAGSRSPYFVKSKGKLLSTAGDWALAQIRLEHLEAYYRGEMEMFVESVESEGGPTVWNVVPKVPAWWPQPTAKEE